MKRLYVTNSIGQREPFSFKKVYNSCRKVGASRNLAEEISREVKKEIYPGIDTSEISRLIRQLLSGVSPKSLIKFSLKEAMMKLGPAGFNFEKYMADILSKNDFEVEINQQIPGLCIASHEIDFLARKEGVLYIGECKYHQLAGRRVDLKVALANYARFLDILKGGFFKKLNLKTIIVTNNKFTSEAIKYSKCMGIELFGWKYPNKKGLENLIEKLKLYPITILPSFKSYFKQIFAQKRMMLASDILEVPPKKLARELKLSLNDIKNLVKEAETLLK